MNITLTFSSINFATFAYPDVDNSAVRLVTGTLERCDWLKHIQKALVQAVSNVRMCHEGCNWQFSS